MSLLRMALLSFHLARARTPAGYTFVPAGRIHVYPLEAHAD